MIGQQHLLIGTSKLLILLKINYKTWEVNVVSRPNPGFEWIDKVLIDQLDSRKFCAYNTDVIVTGSLVGDEIVFNQKRSFKLPLFASTMLIGNQLCGIRFISKETRYWMWRYYKFDLNTSAEETIDVQLDFNPDLEGFFWQVSVHSRC
jgi:hypothetical protein